MSFQDDNQNHHHYNGHPTYPLPLTERDFLIGENQHLLGALQETEAFVLRALQLVSKHPPSLACHPYSDCSTESSCESGEEGCQNDGELQCDVKADFWNRLPDFWKASRNVAVCAFEMGYCTYWDLAEPLQFEPSIGYKAYEKQQCAFADLHWTFQSDRDFVALALSRGDPTLMFSYLSRELQMDRELVKLALVRPTCCAYADLHPCFKMDRELAEIALKCHPNCEYKNFHPRLKTHRALAKMAMDHHPSLRYKDLHPCLQNDHELASIYLRQDAADIRCLSPILQHDVEFLLQVVRNDGRHWITLPEVHQKNIVFAKAIQWKMRAGDEAQEELGQQLFLRLPSLRSDTSFWEGLKVPQIPSTCYPDSGDPRQHSGRGDQYVAYYRYSLGIMLEKYAGENILSNSVIMTKVCGGMPSALALVKPSLASDKEFLAGVLRQNVNALKYLSHQTKLNHPELVADSLRSHFRENGTRDIHEILAPSLWTIDIIKEAWFQAGGPLIDEFPNEWKSDRAIQLAIAENATTAICEEASWQMPYGMQRDRNLMFQLLRYKPSLLDSFHLYRFQDDHEFMAVGFAYSRSAMKRLAGKPVARWKNYRYVDPPQPDMSSFLEYLRMNLEPYDAFILFLWGIGQRSTGSNPLCLLNCGTETLQGVIQKIALFVGVPCGRQLRYWHKARANLRAFLAGPDQGHFW